MKNWNKPKLIELKRGRPEENVLGKCKTISGTASTIDGPNLAHYGCYIWKGSAANGNCDTCKSLNSS